MNTTAAEATSAWTALSQQISLLLQNDPIIGLITILLSTAVLALILIGTVWAVTEIIRIKKQPIGVIFYEEVFTRNVLDMIKELVAFNAERDKLSSKHERIREFHIIRDQMNEVDSALNYVRSLLLVKMSEKISETNPNASPTNFPIYEKYSQAVDFVINNFRDSLRRMCQENHFADKIDTEFEIYIEEKAENTKIEAINLFNSLYSSDIIPAKVFIERFEKEDWPIIKQKYINTLRKIRTISIRYFEQIQKEENDYEKRWGLFLTNIPDMLMKDTTYNPNSHKVKYKGK